MSDVSMHTLEGKVRTLENRVDRIEEDEKRKLQEEIERSRRRNDLTWHLFFFALVLIYAVLLTVVITRKVVGKD